MPAEEGKQRFSFPRAHLINSPKGLLEMLEEGVAWFAITHWIHHSCELSLDKNLQRRGAEIPSLPRIGRMICRGAANRTSLEPDKQKEAVLEESRRRAKLGS